MKSLIGISLAAMYGLVMRYTFGMFNEFMGIMSIAFIFIMPIVIGFVTIIAIPLVKVKNRTNAFFIPWLSCLVLLIITIIIKLEGAICWIMAYPIFAVIAGIGGVIAFSIKKKREKIEEADYDEWGKLDNLNISLLLLFPIVVGMIEGDRTLSPEEFTITRKVTLNTNTENVWKQITQSRVINKKYNAISVSSIIGFPNHLKTSIDSLKVGGNRIAYYEKGLFFEEKIKQLEPNKKLVLDIKTNPSKIPSSVMDEHIVIGGRYLDILEDTYTLEKIDNNKTCLKLSSKFYINTPFNWYASIWAKLFIGDILTNEIGIIK